MIFFSNLTFSSKIGYFDRNRVFLKWTGCFWVKIGHFLVKITQRESYSISVSVLDRFRRFKRVKGIFKASFDPGLLKLERFTTRLIHP